MPLLASIESAAAQAAGNWRRFDSFSWHRSREINDPDEWTIVYTHNRDSGLVAQSNAAAVARTMAPFAEGNDPDVVFESHSHWLVGHVDGMSVRVYRDGEVTEAFRAYCDLLDRLDDHAVLDDEDYSNRERAATLDNIAEAAWRLKNERDLPEAWETDVYSWLADHRPKAVINRDDQGGWPSEDDLNAAFDGLRYRRTTA